MLVKTMIAGVTANESSAVIYPQTNHFREGIVQTYYVAGTGNTVIEGRLHSDAPWQTIVTETGSNAQTIALFPQMRVSTNTLSGATVSVWLQTS